MKIYCNKRPKTNAEIFDYLVGKDVWVLADWYECGVHYTEDCTPVYLRILSKDNGIYSYNMIDYSVIKEHEWYFSNLGEALTILKCIYHSSDLGHYFHLYYKPLEYVDTDDIIQALEQNCAENS